MRTCATVLPFAWNPFSHPLTLRGCLALKGKIGSYRKQRDGKDAPVRLLTVE